MHGYGFDIAHMLAGGLVLVSFTMLYQDRLYALITMLALHALILALSVAWQALVQGAPRVFADHLGPSDELSQRKMAKLYEQLGRVMMERDFLLRKSGL